LVIPTEFSTFKKTKIGGRKRTRKVRKSTTISKESGLNKQEKPPDVTERGRSKFQSS
jgi:hypothetical protein